MNDIAPLLLTIRKRTTMLTTSVALVCGLAAAAPTPDILVINQGIGGNSTRDALRRFERDVAEVRPDHLILYFSMNDALNSGKLVPLEEFRTNMQTLIDRSRTLGVKTIVLTTPNPIVGYLVKQRHPNHPEDNFDAWLGQFDNAIREIARANSLPLADLRKRVNEHCSDADAAASLVRNMSNSKLKDGVHLTADGYRTMGELMAETLSDRVKPGESVLCFGDSITYGAGMAGAGTVYGDTYPAWLSLLLNRGNGGADRERPPAPPNHGPDNIPGNGSFERSADRVHPDNWRVYNRPGVQEGTLTWAEAADAPEGTHIVTVKNVDETKPAYLLGVDLIRLKRAVPVVLTYQTKGPGRLRAVLAFYDKRRRQIGAFPNVKDNPWKDAGRTWTAHQLEAPPPQGTAWTRTLFRVTGEISLDGVHLSIPRSSKSPGGAAVPESRPRTIDTRLSNGLIAVGFAPPEKGGAIVTLRNRYGWEFVNRPAPTGLWKVQLRKIPIATADPTETTRLCLDPEQDDSGASRDDSAGQGDVLELTATGVTATCATKHDGDTFTLSWSGIDIEDEPGVLDVAVTVTLAKGNPFARFRTTIANRSSRYTAFYVTAPFVQGVAPPNGDLANDYLATPCFTGRLVQNPIGNGILGKERRFQPNRSGHSMQFDAYYNDTHGLYLGCFDGQQNLKRYVLEATPDAGLSWGIVHVPNNMKVVPQNWTVPYDKVIRTFRGDWYDAARIYREWALQQTWTAEGPIHERKSTPNWFKEVDEWMMRNFTHEPKGLEYDPIVKDVLAGCSVGHYAGDFGKEGHQLIDSPDRFPLKPGDHEFIQASRTNSRPIMAYIQGICWDRESPSYVRENGNEHTVRNFYGKRVVWDFSARKNIGRICAIAHPGSVWGECLGKTVEQMAAAGMRAAYLDSNNHAGTYMNFNPNYGSDVGGGRGYIQSNRAMVRAMKTRARKVDPGFCFSAESFWEGNMAELDAYLVCNTTYQFLQGDQVTAIPLAHAVYHDRTIMYCSWVGRHDLQEDNANGYVAKFAQTLVWGVKPGWNQPTFFTRFRNKEIAIEFSRKRYAMYRAAKPYLLYGDMLRPPAYTTSPHTMDLRWYRAWREHYYDITLPTVLRSLWRAPDGSVGLVLYNISAEDQTADVTIPNSSIPAGKPARMTYPDETPDALSVEVGPKSIRVKAPLPPRSPALITWR
ncbi:MAG: hypothetical protein HN742_36475 [Lentisphaerae bacterium]|jgi:lysophospholipase L1-like esterase|nr:hypothetical protein [Lentisphaerota bacterium]MBT4820129.1 hypothetical protein [Lentisphaerota bacterium]MBT5604438.1 hypothetical protein [Lentisphaerota bacterium]MBT7058195.1 hypothetical protein [Lentisphaerota bacterium]MBT7847421.1 hypothetical protein [Lentisphaerota bacterium]